MDWKRFDRTRRSVGPVHLDLIEAYASRKISRRDFVRRGTVIGLSVPVIGAVIAACGDDDDDTTAPGTSGPDGTSAGGPTGTGAPGTSAAPGTTAAQQAGGTIKIAYQTPAATLDPIAMQDLGAYGLIAQCFEFLVTLGEGGEIAPGLAESWEPNEDGTVWTFQLRQGVKWHDGSDFTSADVAATMDRLVVAANAGLAGVIAEGAVDATDPNVAVFNLESANGNFPYLVSVFNAQTPITPASYETGTTLDGTPNGTGPWKLTSYDPATGAAFERNPDWWGGQTPLDGQEVQFFNDVGTMVTAMQGGAVDALIQFSVLGGDALLNSPDFTVLEVQSSTHRQIWMRCDTGQFADKAVRQALAFTFDREQMVNTLFQGRAEVANDHVIASFMPFFDATQPPQRPRDVEMARQLLTDAGVENLQATLHAAELQEIPELAQLIQSGAAEAGINLELAIESLDTFYGAQWCPAEPPDPPCSGAAELGIVDYGHRPTPDVFLNAALKTNGVWNSSQYSNQALDDAFAEFQRAVGVEAQTAAAGAIQTLLNDEVPIGLPFFYNYLSGHSNSFQGIRVSALGQMNTDKASRV
jgi:peptide/nickel transport system substrate-binding protein